MIKKFYLKNLEFLNKNDLPLKKKSQNVHPLKLKSKDLLKRHYKKIY